MQIRGTTQILAGTVPWSAMAAGAIVPTASLIDGANFLKRDGSVAMTATFNAGTQLISNVASPVSGTDAATRAYVDAKSGGIGGVHGVRNAASANVSSLSGLQTIDSVTQVAGDITLLIGQTTGSQNGPWIAASGSWTRPTWYASGSTVNEGQYFLVAEGTTYKDTKFWMTTTGTITVDTTSTAFIQDPSGSVYTAGTGLTLTGGAFSVTYGTAAGTAAQGNDSRITGAVQQSALGTNVYTALQVAIGNAGAPVLFNGAGGTPTSLVLANATSLPTTALTGAIQAANFPALIGDVTTTAGSLTATVNATAGSGFLKYGRTVNNELPGGTINGTNATFTLANTPQNSVVSLYLNGVKQQPGTGKDYTISGATITAISVPQTGDIYLADYTF